MALYEKTQRLVNPAALSLVESTLFRLADEITQECNKADIEIGEFSYEVMAETGLTSAAPGHLYVRVHAPITDAKDREVVTPERGYKEGGGDPDAAIMGRARPPR